MNENVQTIVAFDDPDEGEGFFRVCSLAGAVGICVSLRGGGNVGVSVGPEVVRWLIDALEAALP